MISHKKGEFIALSSGEYSDYRFNGLFRAKRDIDLGALAQQYYDRCPTYKWDKRHKDFTSGGFGAWMIASGHVAEINYDEVHCDYHTEAIAHANTRAAELAKKEPQ